MDRGAGRARFWAPAPLALDPAARGRRLLSGRRERRAWLPAARAGHPAERGTFERIAFCPGYLRGLTFTGDYAVVGLSRPRHSRAFAGVQVLLQAVKTRRGAGQPTARPSMRVARLAQERMHDPL